MRGKDMKEKKTVVQEIQKREVRREKHRGAQQRKWRARAEGDLNHNPPLNFTRSRLTKIRELGPPPKPCLTPSTTSGYYCVSFVCWKTHSDEQKKPPKNQNYIPGIY